MPKEQLIYLNSAAVAKVSPESVAAAQQFQLSSLINPMATFMQWMQNDLVELRENVAKMVHAKSSQIAFIPNFSFGLSAIKDSLKPKLKRVLLYREDYPSLNLPFELDDFELFYVDNEDGFSISIEKIKEIALKEKVEVIAISHVQFLTGFTLDIAELGEFCKANDIVFIVDTTQSMGAVELNFEQLPVDVIITSSYKWLNGGLGSAVLLAKDEFIKQFPPRIAGFGSMEKTPEGWSYKPSMNSYEPGHMNPLGLLQLSEGVKHHLKMGVPQLQEYNYSLLKRLVEGIKTTAFKVRGGGEKLSTLFVFEASQEVHEYLLKNNIVTTWRKGAIRVSPHYYNTKEEVDTFIEVLRNFQQ